MAEKEQRRPLSKRMREHPNQVLKPSSVSEKEQWRTQSEHDLREMKKQVISQSRNLNSVINSQQPEGEALPPFSAFSVHVRLSNLPSPKHGTQRTVRRAPYTERRRWRGLTNSTTHKQGELGRVQNYITPPPRGEKGKRKEN